MFRLSKVVRSTLIWARLLVLLHVKPGADLGRAGVYSNDTSGARHVGSAFSFGSRNGMKEYFATFDLIELRTRWTSVWCENITWSSWGVVKSLTGFLDVFLIEFFVIFKWNEISGVQWLVFFFNRPEAVYVYTTFSEQGYHSELFLHLVSLHCVSYFQHVFQSLPKTSSLLPVFSFSYQLRLITTKQLNVYRFTLGYAL